MTLELLLSTDNLDPDQWIDFPDHGFRQYFLWKNPLTGASFALLDYAPGGGIPEAHTHASNQFMYCIKGRYEYTATGLVLVPGSFYMNPKGHLHGPTVAHEPSLLLEVYDGPHYAEMPSFHTEATIGGFLSSQVAPTDDANGSAA
ncbi:MAG: cupin domain-containing protein [Novosphingobium sp.]